jgi:hypothetical protein
MSILDRIKKAHEAGEAFLKVHLWGPNGTGKSTICGTAPTPLLYLYTERQGLISFKRMAPDQDTLRINSVRELHEALSLLRSEEHNYASVCLDSFTEMQTLVADEIVARKSREPGEPVKVTIEEHMFIHDRSKSLVRAFRDLPMNVVMTTLSETVIIGEDSDARTVTRPMLMGRKLPAQLNGFFNLVGFTYKSSDKKGNTQHRVLFDGRKDVDTKGMPGLRKREEPDIAYWYDRAIGGCEARDPEAAMIAEVSRTWAPTDGPGEEGEAAAKDQAE